MAIEPLTRTPLTLEQASQQVRAFAASPGPEDNALSSNVAQTLARIADGMEDRATKGKNKADRAEVGYGQG